MQLQFEDFKGNYTHLNGSQKMKITRMDLCRCVMQVGYKNYFSYISSSIYKRLELLFMVMSNIKYRNKELILKNAYYLLDQSEKVGVSYQIGQGLTKAVAENYFNVPWVAHFSVMKKIGYQFNGGGAIKKTIVHNLKKGKEPDLVGYDKNGQIHLFESKGTTKSKMPNDSAQKAINQVSHYTSVTDCNGKSQDFVTRNACLFTYHNGFQGNIIDPPPQNNDTEYMENAIGYIQCIYNYYYDFLDNNKWLETIHEAGGTWCGYIFSINDKKIFWGVDSSYVSFLNEQFNSIKLKPKKYMWEMSMDNIKKEIFSFLNENSNKQKFDFNDSISIGNDGYILLEIN